MGNSTCKMIGLILLSLLFALGISLNFFACLTYQTWLPLWILLMWFMIPIPAFLWIPPKDRWGEDAVTDNFMDFGFFLTGTLLFSGLAMPVMLAKYKYIPIGAAYMSFGGCIAFCGAGIVFGKVSLGAWTSNSPF